MSEDGISAWNHIYQTLVSIHSAKGIAGQRALDAILRHDGITRLCAQKEPALVAFTSGTLKTPSILRPKAPQGRSKRLVDDSAMHSALLAKRIAPPSVTASDTAQEQAEATAKFAAKDPIGPRPLPKAANICQRSCCP